MSSNTSNDVVFEYMGNGHVPTNVVSVVFHPSVTDVAFREINDKAFYNCSDLREVVLNEGLVKIGYMSFIGIGSSINHNIKIEENVVIGGNSFVNKNCKKNSTYVGSPAKKISSRSHNQKYL